MELSIWRQTTIHTETTTRLHQLHKLLNCSYIQSMLLSLCKLLRLLTNIRQWDSNWLRLLQSLTLLRPSLMESMEWQFQPKPLHSWIDTFVSLQLLSRLQSPLLPILFTTVNFKGDSQLIFLLLTLESGKQLSLPGQKMESWLRYAWSGGRRRREAKSPWKTSTWWDRERERETLCWHKLLQCSFLRLFSRCFSNFLFFKFIVFLSSSSSSSLSIPSVSWSFFPA